jgi:hypothetical protein
LAGIDEVHQKSASDIAVFNVIEDSDIAKDFETFLDDYPESALAPYARNRLALLRQREIATPPPSVTARLDPLTEQAGLDLRPEDRSVVQQALSALGFHTQGPDGIFGANTRRAIIGWQRGRGDEPTGYLTALQYGQLLAEAEPKLAATAHLSLPGFASEASFTEVSLTFVNKRISNSNVFWVDFNGKETKYCTLRPHESCGQRTYVGHHWVVRAEDGQEIGRYIAGEEGSVISIPRDLLAP